MPVNFAQFMTPWADVSDTAPAQMAIGAINAAGQAEQARANAAFNAATTYRQQVEQERAALEQEAYNRRLQEQAERSWVEKGKGDVAARVAGLRAALTDPATSPEQRAVIAEHAPHFRKHRHKFSDVGGGIGFEPDLPRVSVVPQPPVWRGRDAAMHRRIRQGAQHVPAVSRKDGRHIGGSCSRAVAAAGGVRGCVAPSVAFWLHAADVACLVVPVNPQQASCVDRWMQPAHVSVVGVMVSLPPLTPGVRSACGFACRSRPTRPAFRRRRSRLPSCG
jgi:hypothetical protein